MACGQCGVDAFKSLAGTRPIAPVDAARDAVFPCNRVEGLLILHAKGFASVVLRRICVPPSNVR